jgi:hypothetical protein
VKCQRCPWAHMSALLSLFSSLSIFCRAARRLRHRPALPRREWRGQGGGRWQRLRRWVRRLGRLRQGSIGRAVARQHGDSSVTWRRRKMEHAVSLRRQLRPLLRRWTAAVRRFQRRTVRIAGAATAALVAEAAEDNEDGGSAGCRGGEPRRRR